MTAPDIAKKVLAKLEPTDQKQVLDWLHNQVYHPTYAPTPTRVAEKPAQPA